MSNNVDASKYVLNYHDYGTYKRKTSIDTPQRFLIHSLESSDTLTSLAMKYNVTVGSIKQCNNMFSSDISFRKSLKIPLSEEVLQDNTPDLIRASFPNDACETKTNQTEINSNFLERMDQEISLAKSNLQKLNEKSYFNDPFYDIKNKTESPFSKSNEAHKNIKHPKQPSEVKIVVPQDVSHDSKYPYYNPTFRDDFFDL